jgi:regulator of sigma E protease
MEILIKAAQLMLGLSILVIIHELGHFMAARMFGIKVEKFYLFFDAWGVKLFKFKAKGTEYGIGWLPLGGYVKISGMIDESMDKEFLSKPPENWEFRSKPVWQRMIVIMGGIIMNVILGITIFTLFYWHYGENFIPASEMKYGIAASPLAKEVGFLNGDKIISINGKPISRAEDIMRNNDFMLKNNMVIEIERNGAKQDIKLPADFGRRILKLAPDNFVFPRHTFTVAEVTPGSPAKKAGLLAGDRIIEMDGKKIEFFDELSDELKTKKGGEIILKVSRGNPAQTVALNSKVDAQGHLGFMESPEIKTETEYYGLSKSFQLGSDVAYHAVADNVVGLKKMIMRELPANSIHSFIGIANYYGPVWDWYRFWKLTGMLSMVLAFMNLLPIPALDGGYMIFLIAELLRGKPVSIKVLEVAQMTGIAFLVLIMGFAFYNDITQFIIK